MTMPSERTFGALLRYHRMAAHLTQAELVEQANLSVLDINDLERSARTALRAETVRLLAEALELQGEEQTAFFAAAHRTPRGSSPQQLPNQLPSTEQITL